MELYTSVRILVGSPMSTQPVHQTMGPQGTARPQLPSSYLQRSVVNRARSQTQTVNQAECDAIAVAWYEFQDVTSTIFQRKIFF